MLVALFVPSSQQFIPVVDENMVNEVLNVRNTLAKQGIYSWLIFTNFK